MYTLYPPPKILWASGFPRINAYLKDNINLSIFLSAILASLIFPSYSQVRTNLDSGSRSRTSISLSNTMGVYTNLESTPNVQGSVEANLVIAPGSTIQDSFGGAVPGASSINGAVIVTPNSANVDLQGLAANNNYIVGSGTQFSSSLKTIDGMPGSRVGKASTGMSHSMSLTIDQSNSSFSNSFSQNF